jgi:conjugal transfer pilus assembly protein TraF
MKHITPLLTALVLACTGFAALPELAQAQAQSVAQSAGGQTHWWSRSIWQSTDRGPLWYPLPKSVEAEKPTPDAEEAGAVVEQPEVKNQRPAEVQQLAEWREHIENLRAVSIMKPTKENLAAYISAQEAMAQNASVFADTWRRVLWEKPELQYNRRPTNASGVNSYDVQYAQNQQRSISGLAQTHGIYFFFRSDCPYCHVMAPTLQMLERASGIKVIAISLDNKGIANFPQAIADSGQAARLGVQSVPAYYLVQPGARTVMPLGTGPISFEDLQDRIYTLAFTQPGEKF